ncbi:FAS1-like dehydratase domain-containing protein [Litoreibacter arenae]|uniref:FAS1-like dehydratase domain-containing protein n=1 Tax=Litoreibacter arenae DSM 19593 TaxID=1123360 RepID=S9QBZ0_9RHOB|nr:MaoC family dehydratase N-terminal domain-containing protein [Litoreibacter arenae]EPX77088.1 hypothetical protein thalar_02807 [Litoreibacter arenae DSM 19593]
MTAAPALDMGHLGQWLGRTESVTDSVRSGLCDRFHATFGAWLFEAENATPMGLHWCLSPPAVPHDELGPDGHPARGGFLPPVPLESRMWAGGQVRFHHPIQVDDIVTRNSTIASITPKQGRSGPLLFVAVDHELSVDGRVVIEERQDIVYRPATKRMASPSQKPAEDIPPDAYVGDAVTLFRYSAMTFNGHRIHYDYPYVTEVEGYADLVVHGPLQATLLMNAAAMRVGTAAIKFDYRGLAPLTAGQPVMIRSEGDRVWLEKLDGTVTFDASYSLL